MSADIVISSNAMINQFTLPAINFTPEERANFIRYKLQHEQERLVCLVPLCLDTCEVCWKSISWFEADIFPLPFDKIGN